MATTPTQTTDVPPHESTDRLTRRYPDGSCQTCGEVSGFHPCLNCAALERLGFTD